MTADPSGPAVEVTTRRAARGTATVFVLSGVAISSLLSRVPQIRDALHLSPRSLGLLLLMTAVGSLVALPLAGTVVHRIGAARTVSITAMVSPVGLAVVAIGTEVGPAMVGAGLFVFGFGAGQWDVAQNVEGAAVEQRLGRTVMSRFHAAFSLGTVGGALVGAAMNALDVDPLPHLLVAAALVGLLGQIATRGFLPAGEDDQVEAHEARSPWQAWREPRTLLIGGFVLCMAFA